MSSSRRGATKLLYHARRGNMKGDMFMWRASPFAIKCKTRYYERVSLVNEMRDASVLRASPI
jgi:hypothetical protein